MSKTKIVICEDEYIIALDLKMMLSNHGFDVLDIVQSGEKAIEKVAVLKPDLILMDIQLQGKLNGIETAKRITKEYQTSVVFMTGNTYLISCDRKIEDNEALSKPISEYQLLETVQNILK